MSGSEWLVVLAGVSAIAWINWYFFLAERGVAIAAVASSASGSGTTSGAPGLAEATIVVQGGYSPAVVKVKAGQPVRLVFDRRETSGCSEEVVFPDFGIRKYLPSGQRTSIEITPSQAGRYEFTCGMSMLRGTLIAES